MKFTKTETEYNMKSIRFLLLTITTMFIIIAILMIVLGFSVYSQYHSFTYFYDSTKNGIVFTPSVLSIILGIFLFVVTLFGFFGSLKQSTCLVNMYALILTLLLILKLVVVILTFTLKPETLRNYIYIPVSSYVSDKEIEMEIDRLQNTLNCCGANSYLDYVGMDFTNQSTAVITTRINGDEMELIVPESCCSPRVEFCTAARSNSCKTAIINLFVQNASVIGVMGISVMFIQVLGIIFALLLARCIRKMKSERTFLSWKIKEQMILAREEEESTKETQDTVRESNPDPMSGVYIPPHDCSTA
ncbi:CD63 antigen-like [Danaus plexippus]|uniref:CD63 antigen-like n=1 Tax=Danaus plexippus TaxID=13037 RepID=UPI002AAFE4B6|nr:CD63 antigen-like [Danaus plexippus]